ncbi:hypothetical protein GGS23DRAFT_471027 [Durotheca rogersii]|uniref:uncharacterized protein n=1 Tax=Durotheca rogersii TaxID=419775 RepID=UPI00221E9011|nr:uncharacterized protein GGS23DRAFT_471027 [Durotheca rogersii]KAI5855043.1 hypothetical protein GGS23DRAFT_471027 [Durotheca rogersii]
MNKAEVKRWRDLYQQVSEEQKSVLEVQRQAEPDRAPDRPQRGGVRRDRGHGDSVLGAGGGRGGGVRARRGRRGPRAGPRQRVAGAQALRAGLGGGGRGGAERGVPVRAGRAGAAVPEALRRRRRAVRPAPLRRRAVAPRDDGGPAARRARALVPRRRARAPRRGRLHHRLRQPGARRALRRRRHALLHRHGAQPGRLPRHDPPAAAAGPGRRPLGQLRPAAVRRGALRPALARRGRARRRGRGLRVRAPRPPRRREQRLRLADVPRRRGRPRHGQGQGRGVRVRRARAAAQCVHRAGVGCEESEIGGRQIMYLAVRGRFDIDTAQTAAPVAHSHPQTEKSACLAPLEPVGEDKNGKRNGRGLIRPHYRGTRHRVLACPETNTMSSTTLLRFLASPAHYSLTQRLVVSSNPSSRPGSRWINT